MSADALEVIPSEGAGDDVKDTKSTAALSEAGPGPGEPDAALQTTGSGPLASEEGPGPQSRNDSGAGVSERRSSTKDSISKEGPEKRKDSLRKRRVSMFEEKPSSKQAGSLTGGDLKDTLNAFFSTAPKDATETSTSLKPLRRPKLIYENTYRMDSAHPFISSKVQTCIQTILDDQLMDFKYSSKASAHKAMEVAEKMRRNVLAFRFERYKICVLVTIAPLNRQGFYNGFRCLWDANRDSYAVATLRNPSIFAIAVCYGIYYE